MSNGRHYNNFGIEALSLVFVLNHTTKLHISKCLLVSPIIAHEKLLSHLSRKSTNILSFEKYLIENISSFSNFNHRYYDSLVGTFNAIQFLYELEIIEFGEGNISLKNDIEYTSNMGKRAQKINKAALNISTLLQEPVEKLYLNLRIPL